MCYLAVGFIKAAGDVAVAISAHRLQQQGQRPLHRVKTIRSHIMISVVVFYLCLMPLTRIIL